MKNIFLLLLLIIGLNGCSQDPGRSSKVNLKDDPNEAILVYTKKIELDPNSEFAYYSRGKAKFKIQDYKGAILDYNKAIEILPNFTDAYFNRGLALIATDKKNDGCLDLSKAGELGLSKAHEIIKKHCN